MALNPHIERAKYWSRFELAHVAGAEVVAQQLDHLHLERLAPGYGATSQTRVASGLLLKPPPKPPLEYLRMQQQLVMTAASSSVIDAPL